MSDAVLLKFIKEESEDIRETSAVKNEDTAEQRGQYSFLILQ